jgi:hypothetical protein
LSQGTWWDEYYAPLKRRLEALQEMGPQDRRVIEEMKAAEREIEEFDREDDRYGFAFFVLRRA